MITYYYFKNKKELKWGRRGEGRRRRTQRKKHWHWYSWTCSCIMFSVDERRGVDVHNRTCTEYCTEGLVLCNTCAFRAIIWSRTKLLSFLQY